MTTDPSSIGAWPTLVVRDAAAMTEWLAAIGFVENALFHDEDDATVLRHGELLWPAGGGLMLGSARGNPHWPAQPGHGATYLVSDDVDEVFAAATRAGAGVVQEPCDAPHGGRSAAVADPEGNLWSFGSYRPSAMPAARSSEPDGEAPSMPQAD